VVFLRRCQAALVTDLINGVYLNACSHIRIRERPSLSRESLCQLRSINLGLAPDLDPIINLRPSLGPPTHPHPP